MYQQRLAARATQQASATTGPVYGATAGYKPGAGYGPAASYGPAMPGAAPGWQNMPPGAADGRYSAGGAQQPPIRPDVTTGSTGGFQQGGGFQQQAGGAMALAIPGTLEIDGATVVAQVDGHPILASELLPAVNWKIAKHIDKLNPADIPAARQMLLQQELETAIMLRLIVGSARRKIPAKNYDEVLQRIGSEFMKDQAPKLMEEYGVGSRSQLETKLRELGTSLERERRAWSERILAQQWLFAQSKGEKEITHGELLAYYQENVADFQFPSRARWEQLTVSFGEKRSKEEAWQLIALAGNQVLQGAPFADVAKAHSDGTTAKEGGQRPWTSRDSLTSEVLNRALFALPEGQLSPILEDRGAFHIIRVLERQDAGQTPFVEAQEKIKDLLAKDDQKAERMKYMEDLKEKATIWTIFDGQAGGDLLSAGPRQPPR